MHAPRVCTLVLFIGFVCVCPSNPTYGASVRPENAVTYSAGNEGQKICGVFFEDAPLLRSSGAAVVFHTFRWPFFFIAKSGTHAYWYSQLWLQNRRGIPSLPNDRQQHSALPKTKPLALVGARTDSTRRALLLQREAWPIPAHAHWHSSQDSTRRGFCRGFSTLHL